MKPAKTQHVRALGDELQMEEVLDLWPVDLGRPVPVELVEGLEHGESGLDDAALDAAVFACGGFACEQLGEVVDATSACRPQCWPAAGSSRA